MKDPNSDADWCRVPPKYLHVLVLHISGLPRKWSLHSKFLMILFCGYYKLEQLFCAVALEVYSNGNYHTVEYLQGNFLAICIFQRCKSLLLRFPENLIWYCIELDKKWMISWNHAILENWHLSSLKFAPTCSRSMNEPSMGWGVVRILLSTNLCLSKFETCSTRIWFTTSSLRQWRLYCNFTQH